ncbi:MAG TPA: hypothetical protein VMT38_08040, partial [Terracidiphilus sp.]|nr:hypothetical protein [Terracidiphilus sp.]
TRLRARLGWEMDPRTQARYENAKSEGVIEYLSDHACREELEQIGHEEDGLKVLRALEAEGWMKALFPAWTPAKADEAKLNALHELAAQLQVQGVHPDMSAAQMQLLTAKLQPRDLSALKKSLLRPGFVEEWSKLDSLASGFAKTLLSKQNAKPSACFKLFMSYDPEAILWLVFTSKDKAVQERFNNFLKVWPEAHQRIPYALMLEMRITPELPIFEELKQKIFLELIDGKLTTPEEMRAFLEPYSPPAPPPQVTIKRPRARRAGARIKEPVLDDEEAEDSVSDEDVDLGGEDDLDLGPMPKGGLDDEAEEGEDEELEGDDAEAVPGKKLKGQKPGAAGKQAAPAKPAPGAKPAGKPAAVPAAAKPAAAKAQPASAKKPAAPAKAAPKPAAKPAVAAKVPAKKHVPAKAAHPKPKAKPARKPAPKPVKKAHAKPAKPAAKKPAPKAKKKR